MGIMEAGVVGGDGSSGVNFTVSKIILNSRWVWIMRRFIANEMRTQRTQFPAFEVYLEAPFRENGGGQERISPKYARV